MQSGDLGGDELSLSAGGTEIDLGLDLGWGLLSRLDEWQLDRNDLEGNEQLFVFGIPS